MGVKYMKLVKKHKFLCFAAAISLIIAALSELLIPIFIKYAIDIITTENDTAITNFLFTNFGTKLFTAAILMLITVVLTAVFKYLYTVLANVIAEKFVYEIRVSLYQKLTHLNFGAYNTLDTGDTLQRATFDVEQIRKFIANSGFLIAQCIVTILLSTFVLYSINSTLMVVAELSMLILFLYSATSIKKRAVHMDKVEKDEAKVVSVISENANLVRVVRANSAEHIEMKRFNEVNTNLRNTYFDYHFSFATYWAVTDFIVGFQSVIIMFVSYQLYIRGQVGVGSIMAFMTYIAMLNQPVTMLGRYLLDFKKLRVQVKRIRKILNLVGEDFSATKQPEITGNISIDNLSFRYDDKLILDDVSLKINSGEKVAVVGMTASGKSTLIRLLMSFYDYQGSISLDGVELKDINKTYLRQNMAIVMQEPYIYNRTVAENIKILNSSYTMQDVEKAAKVANIHKSIVSFKDGYNTMVGEKGVTLSGGEKQRIAIARVVIDDSKKIIMLDDALSAVDTETEASIMSCLSSEMKDKTMISVTNRLNSIKYYDKIIVMNDAKIEKVGTHQELMLTSKTYQKIYQSQQEKSLRETSNI